ncbi:SGNH hydrolase, partial [Aureobasidium melanogenum]
MVSFPHVFTLLLSLLPPTATCLPSPRHFSVFKPAYFLLAGDSTTATQSVGGGGWGDGFLNFTLREGSSGRNYGHNGATTKSFREGGDWDRLISEAKTKTTDYTVYVTIQFGHNDQKPTSGVNLTQYSDNLVAFAREVSSIGAIPILVTSLTRRKYTNTTTPTIIQDLAVQRNLTSAAARKTHSRYIDLNIASTEYCNAIGPEAAWKYNLNPADYTHLNGWGSVVFGRMAIIASSKSLAMSEIKLYEQDDVPEDIWTLVKQLRIRDLVNAIKQIVLNDFQHLVNVARGRPLNLETVTLLFKEFVKTRTGCATLVTLAVVVGIILLVYPLAVASPFLATMGFTSAGPAAGSVGAAAQSTFGVGAVFSTLQSAAMAGYGATIVAGIVQVSVIAITTVAGYKLWNMRKRKHT